MNFYTSILPSILGLVGFIGNIMFALGVLILIKKTMKNKEVDELEQIGL